MSRIDIHRSREEAVGQTVSSAAEQPFTLIAQDREALLSAAPTSVERFQIKRVFQGTGATMIRLAFAEGQVMREHSTNSPLIVQILEGHIAFRVAGSVLELPAGAVLHVEPGEPHELEARRESHVLLTLCV